MSELRYKCFCYNSVFSITIGLRFLLYVCNTYGNKPCNFIEEKLQHKRFLVIFVICLRTSVCRLSAIDRNNMIEIKFEKGKSFDT